MKNLWFAMINISKSFGGAKGSAETKSSILLEINNLHHVKLLFHRYRIITPAICDSMDISFVINKNHFGSPDLSPFFSFIT